MASHRIIALFTSLTLHFGVRHMIAVMDSLLYRLTGFKRPNSVLLTRQIFLNLLPVMKDKHAEGERCEDLVHSTDEAPASPARFILRKAVMNYAVHGCGTTTESCVELLVRTAVALYDDSSSSAVIFEPFILLNLARWLSASAHCSIHGLIRWRLDDKGSCFLRSLAFVEGLAPCLWDALRHAPALQSVFRFPGRKPPWSLHSARFVLPRLARDTSVFDAVPASPQSLTRVASTPAEVFDWLNTASHPFLIPDSELGADLLFMLELYDESAVLVCVHADVFTSVRARRDIRVSPTSPGEFYKNVRAFSSVRLCGAHNI